MARAAKLKVYRTAIGFHDAYVAAPSQKAALEAWGSDKNLFARGAAELVTDDALTAEPLGTPGKVLKRLRGSVDEQIAALPPEKPKQSHRPKTEEARPATRGKSKPVKARKPPPRPSRAALDKAEAAIAAAEAEQDAALADLRRRAEALTRERRALEERTTERLRKLASAKAKVEAAYREAIDRWHMASAEDVGRG